MPQVILLIQMVFLWMSYTLQQFDYCQYLMDTCIIPKGTAIIEGTVAPNFGQPGGGYQFYVPNPNIVEDY